MSDRAAEAAHAELKKNEQDFERRARFRPPGTTFAGAKSAALFVAVFAVSVIMQWGYVGAGRRLAGTWSCPQTRASGGTRRPRRLTAARGHRLPSQCSCGRSN